MPTSRLPGACRVIQSAARASPAGLVGNCPFDSTAPVAAATTARVWVAACVSTPITYSNSCATTAIVIPSTITNKVGAGPREDVSRRFSKESRPPLAGWADELLSGHRNGRVGTGPTTRASHAKDTGTPGQKTEEPRAAGPVPACQPTPGQPGTIREN